MHRRQLGYLFQTSGLSRSDLFLIDRKPPEIGQRAHAPIDAHAVLVGQSRDNLNRTSVVSRFRWARVSGDELDERGRSARPGSCHELLIRVCALEVHARTIVASATLSVPTKLPNAANVRRRGRPTTRYRSQVGAGTTHWCSRRASNPEPWRLRARSVRECQRVRECQTSRIFDAAVSQSVRECQSVCVKVSIRMSGGSSSNRWYKCEPDPETVDETRNLRRV